MSGNHKFEKRAHSFAQNCNSIPVCWCTDWPKRTLECCSWDPPRRNSPWALEPADHSGAFASAQPRPSLQTGATTSRHTQTQRSQISARLMSFCVSPVSFPLRDFVWLSQGKADESATTFASSSSVYYVMKREGVYQNICAGLFSFAYKASLCEESCFIVCVSADGGKTHRILLET